GAVELGNDSGSLSAGRKQLITISCCSPLTRRSQPSNTSLLLSPHTPKSTLQHFAAVLPSCAEVNPSTLRCCSPLTHRSQTSNPSLLFSPHAPKSTLQHFAAVLPSRAEVCPSTVRCGANLAVMTSKHADCCLPSLQKLCTHYCTPDDGQL